MNRYFVLACVAAIALIAAAYSNSLHNEFHFDDSHVIQTNAAIRSLDNVPRFFTDAHTFSSLPQNATYRPLVSLTLALDYARGALDPLPYHVTQLALLFVLGAMLVAFFVPLVGRWPALFAATFFCVHTANTETMNLISARSELLSTIGLLASFLLYQRSPFARRTFLYLVPLAIGALAKAPLVVFAPLLFCYALWIEGQPPKRALRIALPSLILGIALLIFLNSMNAPEWVGGGGSAWRYAITQPFIWLHYARLYVLPIGLTADTDWQPFVHWYDTRAVAGYAFIALLIFAIRRAPAVVKFGLVWFAIALLPTSIFPLAEVANEHRVFFAFIGLVLVTATFLRTRAAIVIAALLLLVHAYSTHARNEVWRTEESLWSDVVAKSPANGRAWMNFGLTQMSKGQFAAAKQSFDHAATLTPNYSTLEINRGIVEGALGHDAEAERHFERALQLNADHNAHFFYGRWLAQRGRRSEALLHVREAARMSPGFADARELLQQLESARPTYDSLFAEGLAAMQRKDWSAAERLNAEALRLNPRSADALNNRGWALAQLGRVDEAKRAYEQALQLDPHHDRARNNLALLTR